MRYLCIDLGEKRTGLAAGDDETGLIAPLEVIDIPRGPLLLEAIFRAIQTNGPGEVVIGLPLNMDGSEGPAAKSVREFVPLLFNRCGLPVHFQDERLTSHAAEQHLNQSGRTHRQKKELRDALAAAEVLKDFLHAVAKQKNRPADHP